MKKKNRALIILVVIVLCSVVGLYFLHMSKQKDSNPFKIPVNSNELLTESKEGYNSVEVYQRNNRLIINAKSEADFFDGAQFIVDTQEKIAESDVEIIWTSIGGGTEKTENNERIIAEIKIKENGEVIFDKKINFFKKAFEAIEDVLEKKMK